MHTAIPKMMRSDSWYPDITRAEVSSLSHSFPHGTDCISAFELFVRAKISFLNRLCPENENKGYAELYGAVVIQFCDQKRRNCVWSEIKDEAHKALSSHGEESRFSKWQWCNTIFRTYTDSQHLATSISFLLREKQMRESNIHGIQFLYRDHIAKGCLPGHSSSWGERYFFSLIVWKLSLKMSQVYPASVCLVILLSLVAFLLFPLYCCNSL